MFNVRSVIKALTTNTFWKFISINGITLLITTGINFSISLYLLRNISLVDYGTYSSLFAVCAFLVVGAPGLQLFFTKLGTYLKIGYKKEDILRFFFKYSFIIIGIFLLLSFVIHQNRNLLSNFSPQLFPFIWFILGLSLLTVLQSLTDGILKGLQKFSFLGIFSVGTHIFKGIGIIAVIVMFFSLKNILLAFLVCVSLAYFLELVILGQIIKNNSISTISKRPLILPNITQLTITTLLISNFANIELLFSRMFLSPALAGLFAAQVNVAKIVLIASSVITPIVYTLVSESVILETNLDKKLTRQALFLLIGSGLTIVVLLALFNRTAFPVFFHKEIESKYDIAWILGLTYVVYGINDMMVHRLLAVNKTSILLVLFSVNVLEILLLLFFHDNLWQLALIALATQISLGAGSVWYSLRPIEGEKLRVNYI